MTYCLWFLPHWTSQGLGLLFTSAAPAGEGAAVGVGSAEAEAFPTEGGRQLGGPTRRGANADARAARLKALESNNNKTNEEDEIA